MKVEIPVYLKFINLVVVNKLMQIKFHTNIDIVLRLQVAT